jgi:hypothetical protein
VDASLHAAATHVVRVLLPLEILEWPVQVFAQCESARVVGAAAQLHVALEVERHLRIAQAAGGIAMLLGCGDRLPQRQRQIADQLVVFLRQCRLTRVVVEVGENFLQRHREGPDG